MSIQPLLPPERRKSYVIVSPQNTHFREITCREAECKAYERGWATKVDERTELGRNQAGYIRTKSGRAFTERTMETGETVFLFKPGQRCFGVHREKIRQELYVVRGGDVREWTTKPHQLSTRAWLDDFGEHQEKLAEIARRG